jgi:putative endopeptidase
MSGLWPRRKRRKKPPAGVLIIRIGTALVFGILASADLGPAAAASPSGTESKAPPIVKAIDLSAIDQTGDPCTDFYEYACGNWIKNNPLPNDQVRWIRSLSLLEKRYLYQLRKELAVAASKPAGPIEKKYGDFYAACMDVDDLQKKGLGPLKPSLDRIAALNDFKGIAALLGELAAAGDPAPLFKLDVELDPRDSAKTILSISQASLPLLDRNTYGGGYSSTYVVDRYEGHIVRIFMLGGDTLRQAMVEKAAVLQIEAALARLSTKRAESEDPEKRYHVLTSTDLDKLAPDFDFRAYFHHLTTQPIETLNVANPDYLKAVDKLITSLPIDDWRSYFRWRIMSEQAEALPRGFFDEEFKFWDGQIGEQQQPTPRWKQCAAITDRAFGEALAERWVKRNLSASEKSATDQLVAALERALGEEIHALPWMSEETKKAAEAKLAAIRNGIGNPRKWRDYSALKVDRKDFFADLHRDALFERNYALSKLGRPADAEDWDIAAMHNVRYSRSTNSLYIPAIIIQPPLFDRNADAAANFGEIGVLAARELIHGFDALGSKYDERGNVRDWWTTDDRKAFTEATSCEVAQVSEAVPKSDDAPRSLNNLIVAESTATNGGLRIAFRALMQALAAQGKSADNESDGYTESQRLFLSFAQSSCQNQTTISARRSQSADPYSVGDVRVNGAVQNFEEFGKAFQCAKGKPLYPEKSCRVW